MDKLVRVSDVVDWFRAYGHMDQEIPFETLVTDLRGNSIPAADVAPVVHGEWILKHIGAGHYWECSVCHKNPCIYVTPDTKFCPNCGAKTDGVSDG